MSRSLLAVVILSLSACGDPEVGPPYPIVFQAVSDPGAPLAGVALTAAGTAMGSTDAEGRLAVELSGTEGAVVPVVATCPAGHRAPTSTGPLVLRRTIDLATGAPSVLRVTITCPPEVRHGVVLLRAGGEGNREGIPVMIDGIEVARTDRSGVAHVALDRPPGTTVSVVLATSTVLPDVMPRDPAMGFTFPDADEIFVFDRPLEAPPPPPVVIRRGGGHRPHEEPTGPRPPCNLTTGANCR
jgi:hypothetical protein